MDLFEKSPPPPPARAHKDAPLAERMRPERIEDFVGQAHLTVPGGLLRVAMERGEVPSLIFWGPPGTGKTTLARILARSSDLPFVPFSAVTGGVKEIREIVGGARGRRQRGGRATVLFVDEIHRFNKAQQDAFLPHVEAGTIVLLGATTENPSFELNAALLSRVRLLGRDSNPPFRLKVAPNSPEVNQRAPGGPSDGGHAFRDPGLPVLHFLRLTCFLILLPCRLPPPPVSGPTVIHRARASIPLRDGPRTAPRVLTALRVC